MHKMNLPSCAMKTHTTASIQTATVFYRHIESYNWVAGMVGEGAESIELSEVSFMQVAGHLVEVSAANQAKIGTTLCNQVAPPGMDSNWVD